jgi:hypothetical protein
LEFGWELASTPFPPFSMNQKDIFSLIDQKVREVAQIFSQNSTALAREFTLQNAIESIQELFSPQLPETPELPEKKEKPAKK